MKCKKCSQKAAVSSLCPSHFVKYFEQVVHGAVSKYSMLPRKGKVLVAASGGKDSLACLHILSQVRKVEALAVDEGIIGYREHTLKDLKRFCRERKIALHIVSARKLLGFTLDSAAKGNNACSVCGVIRRHILNKTARGLGAKVIATGHNLDDEVQSVMMNIFRNQPELLARLGPVIGICRDQRFIPRIKPLYFVKEKEVAAYVLIKGFNVNFSECPYATSSYRSKVASLLNHYEPEYPGTKLSIIKSFLKLLPRLKRASKGSPGTCSICGEPCMQEVCRACQVISQIKRY